MISRYEYTRISLYKYIRTKGQQDSGISEVYQDGRIKEVRDFRISGYKNMKRYIRRGSDHKKGQSVPTLIIIRDIIRRIRGIWSIRMIRSQGRTQSTHFKSNTGHYHSQEDGRQSGYQLVRHDSCFWSQL